MCLEDLKLGRGRFVGKQKQVLAGTDGVLPADERRVAIMVSFSGVVTFDSTGVVVLNDYCQMFSSDTRNGPIVVMNTGSMPVSVLRIEDLGTLIQGPWSVAVNNTSGLAGAFITEILTNVEADAITR